MNKGFDDGGSSRLSTPMRHTGGGSRVSFDESSKKEKVRRLSSIDIPDETDPPPHSISTKKFLDHCGKINHLSAPRKLRSAMKKQENESQKICGSEDCTKDEEEVAEALFSLAQTFNKTSESEPEKILHVEADVITHGDKSRKRCLAHVYICHFIKADVTVVKA